ncbi:MAG: molybdenum cofactor guanylyltransferase [Acidimicrobiia bacterium]
MSENEGMISHTIGAILAGGSSSRMGADKSELVIAGSPFLDRIHDTMCDVFTEVIVCGGNVVPPDGVLIPDDTPGEGPVGGLLSALRIAGRRATFITAVDIPMLTTDIIVSLVEPFATGTTVRISQVDGEDQPLVGVYGPGVEELVRARFETGKRSVLGVIDEIEDIDRVRIQPDALFNVNTQEDYDRLIERYGA